ncbi:PD-(D/E)XK nuclease family protein [Bacteroides sp. OttesenSCG-928-D19]|nr:PD-(D/E)XK nuclease family protein [Bacteroides sp. OttesenSCG-928-D19]
MENNYVFDYQLLLTNIANLSNSYRKRAKDSGEAYNLFKVIRMTSDEVKIHSAFISDLLSPDGLHGMGFVFTDLFLKMLSDKFKSDSFYERFPCQNAKVGYEVHIDKKKEDTGGRTDIEVCANGDKIIIENKIYASDQENQLIRYDNYGKSSASNYRLLYLSLDGKVKNESITCKTPHGYLEEGKDFFCISYEEDILKWLDLCRKEAVSKPLLREGIAHYTNLIKHLTGQTMNSELKEELADLIVKSSEHVSNLSYIKQSIKLAEEKLQICFWEKLKKELDEKLRETGLKYYVNDSDSGYKYLFSQGDINSALIEKFCKNPAYRFYGIGIVVSEFDEHLLMAGIMLAHNIYCSFYLRNKEGESIGIGGKDYETLFKDEDKLIDTITRVKSLVKEKSYIEGGTKPNASICWKYLDPHLNFKDMDVETTKNLAEMDDTIKKIVESVLSDINEVKK